MIKQIFINMPVADLKRSVEFWQKLGFTFNPQFTDQNAACLELGGKGGNIYSMLLKREFLTRFTKKEVVDASKATEEIQSLALENRQEVDDLVAKAIAAGGKEYRAPEDYGWMYNRNFEDLDGHQWELIYMDMTKVPQNPGEAQPKAEFKPPQS